MSDVSIHLDETNHDVLYARRVEMFFEPNPDGSPSTNGKVVWHTEWWHYSGNLLRGVSRLRNRGGGGGGGGGDRSSTPPRQQQ